MILSDLVILVFGVCAGVAIKQIIDVLILWRKVKSYTLEFPSTQLKSPSDIPCRFHKWKTTKLAVAGLDCKAYDVCYDCGFICGEDRYLNGPGLQVLREKADAIDKREFIRSLTNAHITSGIQVLKETYCGMFTHDRSQNQRVLQMFYDDAVTVIKKAPEAVKDQHGG